ncbi:hypothetical protein BDD43_1691 [Mucilaginibacter gracilis]|uniref:Uncharacterized protein n=1 Tax=Mucilaginibacter gracilis TaxID=423350 RepID=A0A495IZT3_9SPHI|nr:DUF6364 family protein [Mucilaginibacter gracilis]RKR81544.1 hypothetical protein BDD43_1691 [Mucilaginibacter gracilis]
MKTRLNLTIEKELMHKVKAYAKDNNTSVSNLVEAYFKNILSKKSPNMLELIKSLPKPDIDDNLDLKKAFYEENASKYGF